MFWNKHGNVRCNKSGHAPVPRSDEWYEQRWSAIPDQAFRLIQEATGHGPTCDRCAAESRRWWK